MKKCLTIKRHQNPIQMNFNTIAGVARDKSCNEFGGFRCRGFDTYGPFKLVDGIRKGHPDETELKTAVEFYKRIAG